MTQTTCTPHNVLIAFEKRFEKHARKRRGFEKDASSSTRLCTYFWASSEICCIRILSHVLALSLGEARAISVMKLHSSSVGRKRARYSCTRWPCTST